MTDCVQNLEVRVFDRGGSSEEEGVVQDRGEEVATREIGHDEGDIGVVEENLVEGDNGWMRENERMEGDLAEMEGLLRRGGVRG